MWKTWSLLCFSNKSEISAIEIKGGGRSPLEITDILILCLKPVGENASLLEGRRPRTPKQWLSATYILGCNTVVFFFHTTEWNSPFGRMGRVTHGLEKPSAVCVESQLERPSPVPLGQVLSQTHLGWVLVLITFNFVQFCFTLLAVTQSFFCHCLSVPWFHPPLPPSIYWFGLSFSLSSNSSY